MALFERSLTFRVLLIKALQTCSAPLEIRTVNRKARSCVALDKIVNPIRMTRCDEIHHRESYNALVVEECETIRLELMGIRLAAENHSRDDADREDSDYCGPIVSRSSSKPTRRRMKLPVSPAFNETAAARAPTSIEFSYCARSAHTALSSNEAFAEASFTTRLYFLIPKSGWVKNFC